MPGAAAKTTSTGERPKKLQRISQACDLCHRRSIRCRPSAENPQQQCQNCYDFAVDCTYNRPSRRRRNPSVAQIAPPNLLPSQQRHNVSPSSPAIKVEGGSAQNGFPFGAGSSPGYTGDFWTLREGHHEDSLGVAWRSFAAASRSTIHQYMEMYMDVIYPIFPLFHGPTLWDRLQKQHHLTDRSFFASIMAACALVAARARDGAIGSDQTFEETTEHNSEIFFAAAQDAVHKDLNKATGLGYLRACALLALTSMQYGHIDKMHQYMGHYSTLSAIQAFQDEDRWPPEIDVAEREERRRLFWAMYCFGVYSSVVFNSVLTSQETQSNVYYPSESTDEELSSGVANASNNDNWLRGWNFTTDLYRVLEHTIKRLRRNHHKREDRISVVRMMISDSVPDLQIMENVINLYYALPPRFKDFKAPLTGDRSQDVFGFQAANIQATLQLVRITLFESNNRLNVHQKCDVAEQVLSIFHSIEPKYLRALSTPLVYQLGGIGHMLASVMRGVLHQDSYTRVRTLLVSMADLLEGLESDLQQMAGASKELRQQVEKIDQYMEAQRQMLQSIPRSQAPASTIPEAVNGLNGTAHGHQHHHIPAHTMPNGTMAPITNALGMKTPLDEFQLPEDLTGEWPWPFDLAENQQTPNGISYEHR